MSSLIHNILMFSQNKMIERMVHRELHEDFIIDAVNDEKVFCEKIKDPKYGIVFLGTKPSSEVFKTILSQIDQRRIIQSVLLSEDDFDSMAYYLKYQFELVVESPFQKGEVRQALLQIISEGESLKDANVLLVDDTEEDRNTASDILKAEGLNVSIAKDGYEALEIIQSRKIDFDLILTDLGMPKMNGLELIKRLKVIPLCRCVPIICCTSQTDKAHEIEALKTGATDFIFKPIKKEVLVTRTLHHIHAHRARVGLEAEVSKQTSDLKESRKQALVSMGQALAANKSKSEFISTMSHELRTPLNGILGAAEIMKSTAENEASEEWITMIQHNGHDLLNIINNILDFSKMDTGEIELESQKFSVHQMIHGIERDFSKDMISKGQEFSYIYDEDEHEFFRSDPGRIRQILNNLVSNAVKFTKRGKITVKVNIDIDFEDSFLVVQVIDTGRGMSEDQIDYLFEAFTQAEDHLTRTEEGTGLGLAISKSLAKVMGGDLTVTSKLNEGSTFKLRLPVQEVFDETSNTQIDDIPSKGLNIFGLGQKESLEYRFPCVFELDNYKATIFEKSDDLLRHLDLHPVTCPLILIDESFENSNSLEVGKKVLDFDATARCIFTTQEGFRGQSKLVSDYGFSAYLTGSVSEDDFSVLVQKLLKTNLKRTLTKYDISKPTKGKVLLIEDNAITQKIALKLLSKMNIECDIAENGKIGYEQFFKKDYDLVLMDINMPVMNGFDAAQAIYQKIEDEKLDKRKVPIVALTSQPDDEAVIESNATGMSAFIAKPISKQKINEVMTKVISSK